MIKESFKINLASHKKLVVSSFRGKSNKFAASNLVDGNSETYWATDDNITSASIEIDLGKATSVKYVILQEYIKLGQRVKAFNIEIWKDNQWQTAVKATTIGYKRILKIDSIQTQKIRINITASNACPVISNLEIY